MTEIDEILKSGDSEKIIYTLQNGRRHFPKPFSSYKEEINPEFHKVMDKALRPDKVVKVDAEEEIGQKILDLESDNTLTRLEPVARVSLAIQKLIVTRAVSFIFGNDVIINCEPENVTQESILKAINSVSFDAKIRTINRKVANSIFSTTEGAELWYVTEEEQAHERYGFKTKFRLKCAELSPLKGDILYPYFDNNNNLVAFSREYIIKKLDITQDERYFETYTAEQIIKWKFDEKWQLCEGYPKQNAIGKIPIVYGCQRKAEWEDVQGLIERLEKLLSNFADTNDYHASPKIFTTGQILGWAKKGESGAIIEGDKDATAQYLSWNNAPESVRLEIDTLLKMIYTISQTPDISFDSVKGLGNVSGVALKLLFMDAHLKVKEKQEIFDDYLQRRISIILAFLAQMNKPFASECSKIIVEPEITPFNIEDESATINILQQATANKAIMSQKTAIQRLGYVSDVEKEIAQIQEEENAISQTEIFNPTNFQNTENQEEEEENQEEE